MTSTQLPLDAASVVAVGPQGEGGSAATSAPARGTAGGTAAPAPGVGVVPASAPHLRILGLDLSLSATGMSDGTTTWLVRSTGKKDDNLAARTARLRTLRAEVISHCDSADLVVVEGPTYMTSTGHMHDRSGLWWLVLMALQHRGIAVAEVSPPAVKLYATGKGNAKKGLVIEAAATRYPEVEIGGDDNRADALWLHAMGLDQLTGRHVVPESHRRALVKVGWPAGVAR